MKIVIACENSGFNLKLVLIDWLNKNGIETIDVGAKNTNSCDYPDFGHLAISSLIDGDAYLAILICGTGIGMSICANRWRDVRAALCWLPEIASLARQHNDANVLCLPARFLTEEDAISILKTFIETEFEGGRHEKRIEKINPTF